MEVDVELNFLQEKMTILRKAVGSTPDNSSHHHDRKKIPEPKAFDGSRGSKTLENFIWDVEHFFKVSKKKESGKVDIVALYLSDDAKL